MVDDITAQFWQYGPGTSDYTTSQDLLDLGRGKGADFVGQPFNQYRCTATGDLIASGNLIYTGYPIRRGDSKKLYLPTSKTPIIWESLFMDGALATVGDVFVEDDPVYGAGADLVPFATNQFVGFVMAQHPVLRKIIGCRLDRTAQIYRAQTLAQTTGPMAGFVNQTFDGSLPLVCTTGAWAFGANHSITASILPIGIQADRRASGFVISHLEDQTPQTRWMIYVPPISGYIPKEGDWVVLADNSRYRVITPHYQFAETTGSQLLVEREVANDG